VFPTKKRILNVTHNILHINYVLNRISAFYCVSILIHVKETLGGVNKSWKFVVHSMRTW